jgi:hypothetical protein
VRYFLDTEYNGWGGALLSLALVPLFFGLPYQTLMPLFAERVFAVGAAGLGALMAALGSGLPVGDVDNGYAAGVFAARVARRG